MTKYYSKWLDDIKDIRDVELIKYNEKISKSGLPLKVVQDKMYIDTSNVTTMVIGSAGSGKTQATVLPMLNLIKNAGESVLLCDTNGEIYKHSVNVFKSAGYKTIVIDFKNSYLGDYWNPLFYPYQLYKNGKKDETIKLLNDLSRTLLHEESTSDPFWEITASDYFTGLCLGLFQYGKEDEININSIGKMLNDGNEKIGISTYAKEFFKGLDDQEAMYSASTTLNAPNETRGSILAVLRQKLNVYLARESLNQMLSKTNFDIQDIRNKYIIYLVLPENNKSIYPLVNALIEQVYDVLSNSNYDFRFNYILDDFDSLSPINNLDVMVSSARSKNIKITLLCRSYRSLYDKYGKQLAEVIINSIGEILYLITDDRETAEKISLQCGNKDDHQKLISADELLRLSTWEAIMLKTRYMPVRLKLTPNCKIEWNNVEEESSIPSREKININVFDMKKFVKYSESDIDDLIKKIDSKIEELDSNESKTVIEKPIKKIEILKDKVIIYYE